MKKSFGKWGIAGILLVAAMAVTFFLPNKQNQALLEPFMEFLMPLAQGEPAEYRFYDKEGQDVTEKAREQLITYCEAEDWPAAHTYALGSLSLMQQVGQQRALGQQERTLEQTDAFWAILKDKDDKNWETYFTLTGEIQWDQAGQITQIGELALGSKAISSLGRAEVQWCDVRQDQEGGYYRAGVVVRQETTSRTTEQVGEMTCQMELAIPH